MRLAPSILAADPADFAGALAVCEQGGADLVHVDVMDGHFVPNLTFGIPVVKALHRRTRLPLSLMLLDIDHFKGVNDRYGHHVGDQVLPARAWGVEHLDAHGRMERLLGAGVDQFGGEECVEVLLDLVARGRVPEARIDLSVRRLLAVKFRLGLFDNPYVDPDAYDVAEHQHS